MGEDRKLRALRRFVEKLVQGPMGRYVAKIVLFGSVAKGEAGPDSDVDVVVLSFNGLEALRDACAEAAFEAAMETGEGIEVLVYPLAESFTPRSYFTYRALRYGKEVYSVGEQELKRREVEGRLQLARIYLAGAQRALSAGDLRIAIDAAYNAAELCVKGLLLLKLDDLPGSHGGLVGKFGEVYVKTGLLPRALGQRLHRGLEARARARYEYASKITEEMAEEVIRLAQELLTHLEQALETA
jgi:uncharacterized protein (UPF0332 family)/predicted nucleotidyltransferase